MIAYKPGQVGDNDNSWPLGEYITPGRKTDSKVDFISESNADAYHSSLERSSGVIRQDAYMLQLERMLIMAAWTRLSVVRETALI